MGRLDGKVALISGVARGQGRAHAVRLAEEGAQVVGFDLLQPLETVDYRLSDESDLAETVERVEKAGGTILVRRADCRQRSEVEVVVAEGLAAFGHLDIVCANAGINPPAHPFWEIPQAEWEDVVGINLTGVWNTVSAAVVPMIEAGNGGSIIITSSGAAIRVPRKSAGYAAAKRGLLAMAEVMANELAPHMIRVNSLCPGQVNTEMLFNDAIYRLFRPDLEHPSLEDTLPLLSSFNPMPVNWLEPEDIAAAVAWLASDDARYVTGTAIPLDLGCTIKGW